MKFIVLCKSFAGVPKGGEVDIKEADASKHVALGRLISKKAHEAALKAKAEAAAKAAESKADASK